MYTRTKNYKSLFFIFEDDIIFTLNTANNIMSKYSKHEISWPLINESLDFE